MLKLSTKPAPRARRSNMRKRSQNAMLVVNASNRSANTTQAQITSGSASLNISHSYRLPWPPSLNRLWRATPGGVKLSEAGRQYAIAVSNALPVGVVQRFQKRLVVWAWLHAPNARTYDVDNRLKALLDSCTKACLWQDDKLIDEIHVMRGAADPTGVGYVNLAVQELDNYPEIA